MLTPASPDPAPALDRVLAWLAPAWALKRARARASLKTLRTPPRPVDPWRVNGPPPSPWRARTRP
jgi:hypothetical protein